MRIAQTEKLVGKKCVDRIGSFDLCISETKIKHGVYFLQNETFVGEILQMEANADNKIANRDKGAVGKYDSVSEAAEYKRGEEERCHTSCFKL